MKSKEPVWDRVRESVHAAYNLTPTEACVFCLWWREKIIFNHPSTRSEREGGNGGKNIDSVWAKSSKRAVTSSFYDLATCDRQSGGGRWGAQEILTFLGQNHHQR